MFRGCVLKASSGEQLGWSVENSKGGPPLGPKSYQVCDAHLIPHLNWIKRENAAVFSSVIDLLCFLFIHEQNCKNRGFAL